MKYRIDTKQINGYEYITGCTLVSESDCVDIATRYLIDEPVNVADDNRRLQYAIINGLITHFPQEYSEKELAEKELRKLKAYLTDTDYIYLKCMELDLDPTYVYPDIVSKRKEARARIQELQDFDK